MNVLRDVLGPVVARWTDLMELTSGSPFWSAKNGFIKTYEPLTTMLHCDVAIVGGGITGALLAKALVDNGYDTVLLDCRNPGSGSTAASTALIQYEMDVHLVDLAKDIGKANAVTAYLTCLDAIRLARQTCESVGAGEFLPRKSLYFASRRADVSSLREEFQTRQQYGFCVDWLDEADIQLQFAFAAPAAIVSHDAGVLDAYQLAHGLLKQATDNGLKTFARTEVTGIVEGEDGVTFDTNRGPQVTSRWAVIAAGYESLPWLKKPPKISMINTFAMATEPIPGFNGWPPDFLLWESARPYFYARTTGDSRALFGGEDLPFKSPLAREAWLPRKTRKLMRRWKELFPHIPLEVASTWAGTFANTSDGMPYIGFPPEQPRTFFSLCYGGNGIIFSLIAAEMLIAALRGENHPCADIFCFDRK